MKVFDVSGRQIRALIDSEQSAGSQRAVWDGMTARGKRASSGVYFYRFEFRSAESRQKVVMTKKLVILE